MYSAFFYEFCKFILVNVSPTIENQGLGQCFSIFLKQLPFLCIYQIQNYLLQHIGSV